MADGGAWPERHQGAHGEDIGKPQPDALKKTVHATEQTRPDVAAAQAAWREALPKLDSSKRIFLDEALISTSMMRLYGRAAGGQRLVDRVPHGHWKISTFVAVLRQDGMVAPCVIDGAINGEMFLAYVEQVLVPALRPGETVVADNLSSHKIAGVRTAIEAAEANLLFLQPYCSDLNPIEMTFAKLKSRLRAKALRRMNGPWQALGSLSNALSPTECANYFRHAGYFQSA